jgi:hypothetical protein
VIIAIAATITVVLVGGSLLAIHTQSSGYRTATTAGYVVLADRTGQASTATGARLAKLMASAPSLTNTAFPGTARGNLQQGLDAAVLDTRAQARQARNLGSPSPQGDLSSQFTHVLDLRASATEALRTTIDQLLGMQPLPVAGEPSPIVPAIQPTLISVSQASTEMSAEGTSFELSDAGFRAMQTSAGALDPPAHLLDSVWVPAPSAASPLGSASLRATAAALASPASAFRAFHHLVITAVGLNPSAVPTGGAGSVSTSCIAPMSAVPGSSPTVVPPSKTLGALVSVTNCGTVPESAVTVSVTVVTADPPGTAAPSADAQGGRVQAVVELASGASSAPVLGPLPVGAGHRYLLTVAVSLPPAQLDPTGSTQQFLVQITG